MKTHKGNNRTVLNNIIILLYIIIIYRSIGGGGHDIIDSIKKITINASTCALKKPKNMN